MAAAMIPSAVKCPRCGGYRFVGMEHYCPVFVRREEMETYMTDDQIERTFTYQAPFGTQVERYKSIRDKAKEFAYLIQAHCPESREKSLALTRVQESVMFANAAIAINEQPPDAA